MHSIALTALMIFAPATSPTAPASDVDADASARTTKSIAGATVYDFENDNVTGELMSPDGVDIPASHKIRFPSLIKVRGVFVDQMLKMATDV
ncbi:MAG: hypothetical protein R3B09_34490 [Nannocystaceae bacterium]